MTLTGWSAILRYVHYYERPLTHYLLLIYCRLLITRVTNTWPAEKCGKRNIANSDPQNIWNPRKICRILIRGRYIVGTLTNNANIII